MVVDGNKSQMILKDIPKFCITLPPNERKNRSDNARKHFEDVGLENVQFVHGINAEAFGLRTLFPYEVDNPGSGFNIGSHCVGIWLSHWMLWFAASLLPYTHVMIMEDDVRFLDGWRARADRALADVPADFDWLFLGSCCCGGKPQRSVKGEVWAVEYPMCFHAYVVAAKCLPHLLATQRKCYAPIDISLPFHSFDKMRVFAVLPRIAEQFKTDLLA